MKNAARREEESSDLADFVSEQDLDVPFPKTYFYRFYTNRADAEFDQIIEFYREKGASELWVESNKTRILRVLSGYYRYIEAEFARTSPDIYKKFEAAIGQKRKDGNEGGEVVFPYGNSLAGQDEHNACKRIGEKMLTRYPNMPHKLIDECVKAEMSSRPKL